MRMMKTAVALLLIGVFLAPAGGHAQSNDIMNRLDRLENEIQTLNRAMYKGEPPPMPVSPVRETAMGGDALVRVQQIESDLRALTGRVEQQTYEIDQLKQQVEAMTYQMQQTQNREPTPVVPQSAENLRPDDGSPVDQPPGEPPPQPAQMGMRTATPTLPSGADPTALYEAAYNKIKTGDYEAAEMAFQQFIDQYPDHKLAGNSYYWLGETYYVRGDYDQATRIFAQSYQKFPKGPKGPDNLLKLGLSLAAQDKEKDACVALMQLGKEYPAAAPEIMATADTERQKLGC